MEEAYRLTSDLEEVRSTVPWVARYSPWRMASSSNLEIVELGVLEASASAAEHVEVFAFSRVEVDVDVEDGAGRVPMYCVTRFSMRPGVFQCDGKLLAVL